MFKCMNIIIFLYFVIFVFINRYLFDKIRENLFDLAKINGVNSSIIPLFLEQKKKKTIKSMISDYLSSETTPLNTKPL